MRKHVILFLGLLGCSLGAGCNSTTDGPTFTCNYTITTDGGASSVCAEYVTPPITVTTDLETACMAEQGTPGSTCSSAGRLGTCARISSTTSISENDAYYSDGGLTAAEAQAACTTSGGTWTPG
jgi:hypothetical protein